MSNEIKVTRRHVLLLVAVFVVTAVLAPIAVSAAAQRFADVPPTDWAYNDVQWLAEKGLTGGCGDGTNYCPDGTVTRREVAVFTHREQLYLGTRLAIANSRGVPVPNDSVTRLATAYITVPTAGGAVTTNGHVTFEEPTSTQTGFIWIEFDNGGRCATDVPIQGIGAYTTQLGVFTSTVTLAGFPASVGQKRIDLCAWGFGGTTASSETEIQATWIAAGATGGDFAMSSLATASASNLDQRMESLRQKVSD